MTHKTLVIDLDRCIGCFACEMACKQENNVPLGVHYNKVLSIGPMGKFPDLTQYFLPTVCQHCKDAPCVKVCPTGATYQTEDGQVLVNKEKCIGCKMCMAACPYCAKARFFGDVDDPESDVSKVLAAAGTENVHSMPDSGNHPTVRYILHKKTGEWQVNPPKMVEN